LRYQQGRLEEAAKLSFENIEIVKLGGFLDCVAGLLVTSNRLSSRHTGQHGARHFLDEGERLAHTRHWPRLRGQLLMERTRSSLLERKSAEALACAQQLDNLLQQQLQTNPEEAGHYRFMACQAALWCEAMGLPRSADLEQARALLQQAQRDNRRLMQILLTSGLALVHWLREAHDEAVTCLLDTTQLTEATGAWQLLVDLPAHETLALIATHALQRPGINQQQQVRLRRLLPDSSSVEPSALAQPAIALTSKERHVLELVAQGKSNKEMAKLLGIAPETIKSHMKNIFGKLQVDSRAQAAVAAKAAGLI
jgi:LuxR family maltose regulon positive regulatory protein